MREIRSLPVALRWLLAAGFFSATARGLTLPYMYVYMSQQRDYPAWLIGVVLAVLGLGASLLMPVGGKVVDAFGSRLVIPAGFAIQGLAVIAFGLTGTPLLSIVCILGIALGAAVVVPGQSVLLAERTTPDERTSVFSLQFLTLNLGVGIGAMIGGLLVGASATGSYTAVFLVNGLLYLVPMSIIFAVGSASQSAAAAQPAKTLAAPHALRDRTFVLLMVALFVLMSATTVQQEVGFTAFSVDVAGISPQWLGWCFAVHTAVIVTLQMPITRRIGRRLSHQRALALSAVPFVAAWLILGLSGLQSSQGMALALVLASIVVFTFGEMLFSPSFPSLVNQLAPDERRGEYNGFSSAIFNMSGTLAPLATAPAIGYGYGMAWIAAVATLSALGGVALLAWARHATPRLTREAHPQDPGPSTGANTSRDPAEPSLSQRRSPTFAGNSSAPAHAATAMDVDGST